MADEPLPLLFVLRERLAHRLELLLRRRGVVGLEDPGVRLDDLAERPEAHALAVREGTALAPGDDLLFCVRDLEELGDQAALADPRNADEGQKLGDALVTGTVEGVTQGVQLALATD